MPHNPLMVRRRMTLRPASTYLHALRRLLTVGVIALPLATAILLGQAAPANALGPKGAYDLWQYALTLKAAQLQSAMGPAAQAAWSPVSAKLAATTASQYNAQAVYGNVALQEMAEVIPIREPKSTAQLGAKLTPGVGGSGPKLPALAASKLYKSIGGSTGAAGIALSAFAFRADIANGVLSWFGMDAQDTVCSAEPGGGFVNIITGQDCAAWEADQEYIANSGIEAGVSGGQSCGTAYNVTQCVSLTGKVNKLHESGDSIRVWTFARTEAVGGVPGPPQYTLDLLYLSSTSNRWITANGSQANSLFLKSSSGATAEVTDRWNGIVHTDDMLKYKINNGPEVTPTQTDMDPERQIECVVTLSGGGQLSGVTANFRESEAVGVTPNCPAAPAGQSITKVQLYSVLGAERTLIDEKMLDPEYTKYQEEYGTLCGQKTCFTDLVRLVDGMSCFGLADACDGWMTSPTRDTDYGCEHGGRAEPIQSCYMYANTFNEQKRLAGNAYADPKTGRDTGGGTSKSIEEIIMGRPVTVPGGAGARDCWGRTGWGELNPLQWVVQGGQCVLEWAFVPSVASMTTAAAVISDEWETTAPGKVITTVRGWNLIFNVNGCSGIPFVFTYGPVSQNIGLPSACPGTTLAPFAGWVRTLGALGFMLGGAMVIRKFAGSAIGMNAGA